MSGTIKPPRILAIAGSDSSGGAGIQADIKTITMLGGYAMTAITAVTAQDTLAVSAIEALSPELVGAQIDASTGDIRVDAVKIGMLGSPAIAAFGQVDDVALRHRRAAAERRQLGDVGRRHRREAHQPLERRNRRCIGKHSPAGRDHDRIEDDRQGERVEPIGHDVCNLG